MGGLVEPESAHIIPQGKSKLGRYRSMPVPSEWFDYLRPCQVFSGPLKAPLAPDLWGLLNLYLSDFNKRLVEVFKLRSGLYDGRVWTLEEVGQKLGVTRERIRQIEKKINQDKLGRELRQAAWVDFREVAERSVWVFRLAGDAKTRWPYSFVAKTYGCELVELKTGCWAILRPHLKTNTLTIQIREQPRFYTLEEAEPLTTLNAYELIHTCSAMDGLFVTRGGLIGSYKWTLLGWMQAIAGELAKNGVYEWHFSQMAKLLRWINPDEFGSIIDRNIAAALARNDSRFQNAGRDGVWRLENLGDGFADTKEAVLHILGKAKRSLHHTEIFAQLARPVRPETLTALLSREVEFLSLGEGHYALSDQHYLMLPAPRYSARAVLPQIQFELPRISVVRQRVLFEVDNFTLDLSPIQFLDDGQLYIGEEHATVKPTQVDDPSLENHLLFWLVEFEDIDLEVNLESLTDLSGQVVSYLASIVPSERIKSVIEQYSYALACLIYEQIQLYSPQDIDFEVQLAEGTEELKAGLRRSGGQPTDFWSFTADVDSVDWREYSGFDRCIYPIQVLGRTLDLELVWHLEQAAICWFRPVQGQFAIYLSQTSETQYQPDFVAEFIEARYLIITSQDDSVVRKAALKEWCKQATEKAVKPWQCICLTTRNLKEELKQMT